MKENTGREKQIERCKENKAAEVEIQKKKFTEISGDKRVEQR